MKKFNYYYLGKIINSTLGNPQELPKVNDSYTLNGEVYTVITTKENDKEVKVILAQTSGF
jgi:hypothetical protein